MRVCVGVVNIHNPTILNALDIGFWCANHVVHATRGHACPVCRVRLWCIGKDRVPQIAKRQKSSVFKRFDPRFATTVSFSTAVFMFSIATKLRSMALQLNRFRLRDFISQRH